MGKKVLNTMQNQTAKKLTTTILFLISLFFFNTSMAWEKGFDILTAGHSIKHGSVLFAYDRDTGRAYKYNLYSSGIGKKRSSKVFKWRKSWTHMDLRDRRDLRMYHSGTTGDVQLYQMKSKFYSQDKKTKKIKTYKNFYKGFDIVEAIHTGLAQAYLFYDKDKGFAKIYQYNPDEHNFGAPVYKSKNWHQGWDIIKEWSFDRGKYRYLLFYDREEGLLRIKKVDSHEPVIGEQTYESSKWRHTWHSMIPYSYNGNAYLLCYDKTNGVGKVFKLDYKTGTIKSLVKEYTGWRKSWDTVDAYYAKGGTRILFYDKHSGDTNVYKIGSGGRLTKRVQSK